MIVIYEKTILAKENYEKVTFKHKFSIVGQIQNGQISANFATKKYPISRSTSAY